MPVQKVAFIVAALAFANDAFAQTTNCMDLGGNMIHCDSMGPNGSMSSTNCSGIGGGMLNCNTMDMSPPRSTSQAPELPTARHNYDPPARDSNIVPSYPPNSTFQRDKNENISASFDLLCTGEESTIPTNGTGNKTSLTKHYRIDAKSYRWCDGDCTHTRDIVRIDSRTIYLEDSEGRFGISDKSLNREEGSVVELWVSMDGASRLFSAKCEVQPFTGLPTKKF